MALDIHHQLSWQNGMFPATHRHLRLDVFAHHDATHLQTTWNVWEGLDNSQVALTAQAYHMNDDGLIVIGQGLVHELRVLREGLQPWHG